MAFLYPAVEGEVATDKENAALTFRHHSGEEIKAAFSGKAMLRKTISERTDVTSAD